MINRKELVRRHNVRFDAISPRSPLSVGNGNFAFTADVTGLQSVPDAYPAPGRYVETPGTLLGTQSSWGWHSTPVNPEPRLEDTLRDYASPHGRVAYVDLSGKTSATALDGGTREETWLRNNPHRTMLGSVALAPEAVGLDGIEPSDLESIAQTLDLWTGTISSAFSINGIEFGVETTVHPELDVLAVSIQATGGPAPAIRLSFPYGSEDWGNSADWSQPGKHHSSIHPTVDGWHIARSLDSNAYGVAVAAPNATLSRLDQHTFLLSGSGGRLDFCLHFHPGIEGATDTIEAAVDFAAVKASAAAHWERFWLDGGAVDFAGSTDPRAFELERRVVLSQYLMAINCSGAAPPQETGLMVNSWRGRFHLEMHWWHGSHFPVWNRPHLLQPSLDWYFTALDGARETARRQGFDGVRWPKQVAPDGRESPSDIGPFLIWQQPHPIYLAELLWRSVKDGGGQEILEKYAPLVFETAAFMASFAAKSEEGMILGPPLVPAQESYGFMRDRTQNPTFELAYWTWALDTAQAWRRRLGLADVAHWSLVAQEMVPPHVENGIYSAISVPPFTIREDHPSMLAALGFLPQTANIDPTVMNATLDSVLADWDWSSTWGWDYPTIAMTATRLGRPDDAVAALFMDKGKNTYLANGHNFQTDALPIYLPGNGGLLTAVALMAAGFDGSAAAPGFPQDGTWNVAVENILRLP